ncbi:MAG: hypothetical protein JXA82_16515 [Sedimentisphaerales bacterium]|nr:hypothetical protein [Sedimentisphaerales bacterium]
MYTRSKSKWLKRDVIATAKLLGVFVLIVAGIVAFFWLTSVIMAKWSDNGLHRHENHKKSWEDVPGRTINENPPPLSEICLEISSRPLQSASRSNVTKPSPLDKFSAGNESTPKRSVITPADYETYMKALAWVESRNRPIKGKNGELGPWQITRTYWEEGLVMYGIVPNTPGYEFTLENCSNSVKAWAAISGYALRYDQEALLTCNYRRMAYLHIGINKSQKRRDEYANNVLGHMEEFKRMENDIK